MKVQCHQFRELADSYLGNELSVETNHAVISHVEHCIECRSELAARRALRMSLRAAFMNAPENQMRPEFASLLSSQLHDHALSKGISTGASLSNGPPTRSSRQTRSLALVACLVIAAGLGLILFREWRTRENLGREPIAKTSAGSDPGLMLNLVKTELAKSAVGDHRDCAIHFRLADKPIDLEEAGRKFDPAYMGLTKAVLSRDSLSPNLEFVEAHSCVFEGRRFAHIVLRYHGGLVSFLVTDSGGTIETKQSTPPMVARDQVIACSQFDGYRVSCFQTARHAIFVVSDLPEGENLALARALAPSVVSHLTRTERAT